MYILLAIGNITTMPEIEENEVLHIISTATSTIPITALSTSSGKKEIHLISQKAPDNISIALEIGAIVAASEDDMITVFCQTEAQVKAFEKREFNLKVIKAILLGKTGRSPRKSNRKDPVEKTAEEAFPMNAPENNEKADKAPKTDPKKPEVKEKPVRSSGRKETGSEVLKDIPEKYHDAIREAARDASDGDIGFPMQLQTKLVFAGCDDPDEISRIVGKVKGSWKDLKRQGM